MACSFAALPAVGGETVRTPRPYMTYLAKDLERDLDKVGVRVF